MRKEILIITVAAFTLNSCGIYTKYKPAADVPDGLYGEEVAVSDSADNFGNLGWREVFTDPYLRHLIERGLQNNTDLQSAQWRVKEAEATLMSAKLAFLPSFALAPQGVVSSFDGGKATQTYSVPVTASWELDIFGRMRNAKLQAKALLEQSHDYRQAVQTQLVSSIANVYYTLLMLDEQLAISERTQHSWKETVDATRALMNAGLANEAAVSQMEAVYYNISTSILSLKEQINQTENSLSLLLAESPGRIERGKLKGQSLPEHLAVGIPVQLLANRPDVRRAEHSLESAFYATNQARSAFYPSVVLSGSAGWTNSAGGMIVNPGEFLATAVGALTQPLFNRGANIARLKIAKAQQEEARLSFRQALLNAGSEVNDALVKYQTARDKAGLFEQQIASLERAYESTSLTMQYGNTTYLEVLTAQQSLLNAQLTQVTNRFTEIQGVINLYQALGGGRE